MKLKTYKIVIKLILYTCDKIFETLFLMVLLFYKARSNNIKINK